MYKSFLNLIIFIFISLLLNSCTEYPSSNSGFSKSLDEAIISDLLDNIHKYEDVDNKKFKFYIDSLDKIIVNHQVSNKNLSRFYMAKATYLKSIRINEAYDYAINARELAIKVGDPQIIYASYVVIAKMLEYKVEYEKAIEELKVAKKYTTIDQNSEAHRLILMAWQYNLLNQFDEALKGLYKAEKVMSNNTDPDLSVYLELLHDIGDVLIEIENSKEAKYYLEKGLNLITDSNRELFIENEAFFRYNLSKVYFMEEDIHTSLKYAQQALQTFEKFEMGSDINIAKGMMAICYLELGIIQQSEKLMMEVTETSLSIKDWEVYSTCGIYLSDIYLKTGRAKMALRTIDNAIATTNKYKTNPRDRVLLFKKKYETYAELGNYRQAYKAQEIYFLLKDSVYSIEKEKAINDLKTKYDTEKKEQQIESLEKEKLLSSLEISSQKLQRNSLLGFAFLLIGIIVLIYIAHKRNLNSKRIILEQNKQITKDKNDLLKLNNYKDRFFSIIAHDLRNPLSAFKNILGSLAENDSINDIRLIKKYLSKLYFNANKLEDTFENLLRWSLSQLDSIKSANVDLNIKEEIKNAISVFDLNLKSKNIDIFINIEDNVFIKSDKDMFSTIIRNLVSNAIKFSGHNSEILIEVIHKENDLVLSIRDNGVGMTELETNNLFEIDKDRKAIGDSTEKGTGLGLLLARELTEKIKGNIWVNSIPDKGTTFYISLPKANYKMAATA